MLGLDFTLPSVASLIILRSAMAPITDYVSHKARCMMNPVYERTWSLKQ